MDPVRGQVSMGNCRSRKLDACVSVIILEIFIGCMLLTFTAFASPTHPKQHTLQQVVFLFCHGDRTPLTTPYPKDPYINYTWPDGLDALTKRGMRQLYDVGQWIRQEYGEIISNKFENATTLVLSSDENRCIMSAQALLAGLFIPSPENMFLPELAWIPVPIHTIPRNVDKLITVRAPCPRLTEATKQTILNEEINSSAKRIEYYKALTEHTGLNISNILDILYLYDTLTVEKQYGLRLPEWTQNFYNNEMRELAALRLALYTNSTIQKRLRGGPLLKEILLHMEEVKINSKSKQSYFYSAHDLPLINVLRTMGFTKELIKPDYGAMLIFELHLAHNGVDQEVKVLYLENANMKIAHSLTIPNCASPCLLQNLKKILHEVIPNDWDVECKI